MGLEIYIYAIQNRGGIKAFTKEHVREQKAKKTKSSEENHTKVFDFLCILLHKGFMLLHLFLLSFLIGNRLDVEHALRKKMMTWIVLPHCCL